MDARQLLIKQAQDYPQKPAVVFLKRQLNFSQLKQESFRVANYLLSLGLKKGDKLALYLPNSVEYVLFYLGAFSCGITVVPLDYMLTEEEIANILTHSQAKVLIGFKKKHIDYERIALRTQAKTIEINKEKDDLFQWVSQYPEDLEDLEINPGDLAIIAYTSGTTGAPKGVMLTYSNLDFGPKTADYILNISEKDNILCALPFSHSGGIVYILLTLIFAMRLIIMERFLPLEFLKNIAKYEITFFWLVPSMYIALLTLKDFSKIDLSSLRYVVVFGAPSSPALLKRFHRYCPKSALLNGWGMTETSAPTTVIPPGSENIKSVGVSPSWVSIKIVDEEGNNCPKGKVGQLLVKGDFLFKGYYRNEELNKKVFTPEGFFRTGDLAYLDENGFLYIAGRIKDMIKVGGEIVFSSEIEEKILRHPKVKEAAVIGVKDNLRGEVPKAFIVAHENEHVSSEELRDFLRSHLAHFKMPHFFEFVNELPKTRSGKINRAALIS